MPGFAKFFVKVKVTRRIRFDGLGEFVGDFFRRLSAIELAKEPKTKGIADVNRMMAQRGDTTAKFLLIKSPGAGLGPFADHGGKTTGPEMGLCGTHFDELAQNCCQHSHLRFRARC